MVKKVQFTWENVERLLQEFDSGTASGSEDQFSHLEEVDVEQEDDMIRRDKGNFDKPNGKMKVR